MNLDHVRFYIFPRKVCREDGGAWQKGDFVLWRGAGSGKLTETALPVPLEGMNVVPSLLQVGDEIGFLIARPADLSIPAKMPTPSRPSLELVGPFRILRVGDEVVRVGGDRKPRSGGNERLITVALKLGKDRQLDDPNVVKLLASLCGSETDNKSRVHGVALMPRAGRK